MHELAQTLKTEFGFLHRLSCMQLRDAQWADDVVQDTALSAWRSLTSFENKSSMRTWLVGILRHKIIDALRERKKQSANLTFTELEQELPLLEGDALFDEQGAWREAPRLWSRPAEDPAQEYEQKQQLQLLQLCVEKLPEKTAQIFLMREYLGFDGGEIAQHFGLQAGHVRVTLLRARLALRACMELQMMGQAPGSVA